jgi:hypothetical protein
MSATKARCPLCKRTELLGVDGRFGTHYTSPWADNPCEGSRMSPVAIEIERAERDVGRAREAETRIRKRIEDAKATIEVAEAELAAQPAVIAKAERKLEALRTKLAKDGAQ